MVSRHLALALVVSGALALAACARAKPAGAGADAGAEAADATAPAAATSASSPPRARAATAPSADRRPMTADEKQASKTYAAALGEGRAATSAKRYDDAIAAFDRAIAAKPGDARALSERGYARLLARDLASATKDLDRALEGTSDPALSGPIHFNLGLVAEARGDAEGARVAFARSNAVRPTKAAQAKLAGKSACVAVVDRSKPKAKVFASLAAAHAAMRATADKGVPSAGSAPTDGYESTRREAT